MNKPITSRYVGKCKCGSGILMKNQEGNIYCTACPYGSPYRKMEQVINKK